MWLHNRVLQYVFKNLKCSRSQDEDNKINNSRVTFSSVGFNVNDIVHDVSLRHLYRTEPLLIFLVTLRIYSYDKQSVSYYLRPVQIIPHF